MKVTAYILFIILLVLLAQLSLSGKQGNPHGEIKYDCIECHSSESWKFKENGSVLDHGKTGFALIGGHQNTDCRSCHENLVFSNIGTACLDCHTDIHKNELGVNCEDCHTPLNWENRQEILKEHNSTQFPLVGVHAVVECEACHINQQRNEYKNTPVECEYCHQDSYNETLNPNHQLAKFELDCISCHQTIPTTWNEVNWQHPQTFDLKGGHKNADCVECHENNYESASSECIECHSDDYESTTFPDHSQLGYPEDCLLCHTEQQWEGAIFDHLQNTGFELRETHANLICQDCHINGQVSGLPTDCIGCHQNDFDTVLDPNHIDGQFSTDCLQCHNETVWTPATFDHNNTQFPLLGAHISVDCIDCHADGYTNTPTDCFFCHETDYNNTTDPNHIAAQFPNDCESCHNTTDWTQTTWDHDNQYFPIYTGRHEQEWTTCDECHVDPNDYTVFECIFCHPHNDRTQVDNDHSEVNDYVYASWACYDCHPDGRVPDKFKLDFQKAH